MKKIALQKYPDLVKHSEFKDFPLINSVLSGRQAGSVYVDENSQPNIQFVINKYGFSQLWLNGSVDVSSLLIDFFLFNKEIPQYFHIYNFPDNILPILNSNESKFSYKIRDRVQLRWDENILLNEVRNYNSACVIKQIDLVTFDNLGTFNLNIDSRFWSSKNDFLSYGYGIVVFSEGNPVSVCYSACVQDGVSEIDIATLEKYRGKGFAKIATIEFIKESLKRKNIPNWDCFKENKASLELALNLGFKVIKEYKFLSIYKK